MRPAISRLWSHIGRVFRLYEVFNYVTGKTFVVVPTERLARWIAVKNNKWDYAMPGYGFEGLSQVTGKPYYLELDDREDLTLQAKIRDLLHPLEVEQKLLGTTDGRQIKVNPEAVKAWQEAYDRRVNDYFKSQFPHYFENDAT